jgi:hypothetical protein
MSNKIIYRNNKGSLINKSVDPVTGSEFWSIEGKKVQFTWFDVPANTNFPNHKHDSEQITYVLEGDCFSIRRLVINYQRRLYPVPGNVDHEVWTENLPLKRSMLSPLISLC